MKTEKKYKIEYSRPSVTVIQDTGIGVAEVAARTCYDSFSNSENEAVKDIEFVTPSVEQIDSINNTEHSDVLDTLAWTYFHHSVLEHANISYLIRGTSRGVLQEHARHRIQSISVRSTRYTMGSIINAYVASKQDSVDNDIEFFIEKILSYNMFVTTTVGYNKLEITAMYNKLDYQFYRMEDFYSVAVAKSSLRYLEEFKDDPEGLYIALQNGKAKRNVGDAFKHIITDNVKVDMVVTFNLRSLKNYLTLRDSGSAFFQMRWLAEEIKKATPSKYLDLIIKGNKNED